MGWTVSLYVFQCLSAPPYPSWEPPGTLHVSEGMRLLLLPLQAMVRTGYRADSVRT